MQSIAFATCKTIPEPDVDEPLVLAACEAAGISADLVAWEDTEVDWSIYSLVLPRSTWNYHLNEAAFRDWVARVNRVSTLWNPASLILWNMNKRYLVELERHGVPIVPTLFVNPGAETSAASVMDEMGWSDVIIKPAVSAASHMTERFGLDRLSEADDFLGKVLDKGEAMVQPFMHGVHSGGEIAFVHIAGELTHGIVKEPRFAGGEEIVSTAIQPNAEQRALCQAVMATVSEPWLYSRVDLMKDNDGRWVLSELEMIEPSLFFRQYPASLRLFIDCLREKALAAS